MFCFLALVAFFVKPKEKDYALQCHLSFRTHKQEMFSSLFAFYFFNDWNTLSLLLIEPIHLWQMQGVLQLRQGKCASSHSQDALCQGKTADVLPYS